MVAELMCDVQFRTCHITMLDRDEFDIGRVGDDVANDMFRLQATRRCSGDTCWQPVAHRINRQTSHHAGVVPRQSASRFGLPDSLYR